MGPKVPERPASNDQPSVTVADITDPAIAGEGLELLDMDALDLTSAVPFRARRVVVRLESSTVVYHSTNHRIRTRTKAQRGQLAYVVFGPQARSTVNGVLMRPELILAVEPETEVVFVTAAGGRGHDPPAVRVGEEAGGHGRAPARPVQRP